MSKNMNNKLLSNIGDILITSWLSCLPGYLDCTSSLRRWDKTWRQRNKETCKLSFFRDLQFLIKVIDFSGSNMSQSRTTRTRSRRGSLEKESENSMDDNILPATVVEAVRKSSRGRILKESSKVAGRMRNKNDTEVEKDKTDSSDNDIKDGFQKQVNKENVNGSKSVSSDSSTGQPLVLDDLIDDFGDEELEDCESAGETGLSDDEIENEESELILELPADSDEEVSNEIAEEMKNYEPSTLNTCKLSKGRGRVKISYTLNYNT